MFAVAEARLVKLQGILGNRHYKQAHNQKEGGNKNYTTWALNARQWQLFLQAIERLMTIQSAKRTQLSYANMLIADALQTRLLT